MDSLQYWCDRYVDLHFEMECIRESMFEASHSGDFAELESLRGTLAELQVKYDAANARTLRLAAQQKANEELAKNIQGRAYLARFYS